MSRSNRARQIKKIRTLSEDNDQAKLVCLALGEISEEVYDDLLTINFTGQNIVFLYDYVCTGNASRFIALVSACRRQLDGLTREKLIHAAHNRGAGINVDEIIAHVTRPDS